MGSSACTIGQMISYHRPAKEFRRLETVIGMAMSSPAGSAREYEIRGDGRVLRPGRVVVGSAERAVIDITGVEVLEIEWSPGEWCGTSAASGGTFVLGDPFLYR